MMLKTTFSPKKKSVEMDPEIWSRLPDEVLEHVLFLMPIKNLLNIRSTCKHFKSLIFSPSFISKYSASSSSISNLPSFVLLSHPLFLNQFCLYDSCLGQWRSVSLSSSSLLPSPATILSVSNGLLCFSLPNASSFLVCNFLATSSRKINFPTFPFGFEFLTLIRTRHGYKIFMLSSGSSLINAFVYDSRTQLWQEFEGFNPILTDNHHHQEGVFHKGLLYFITPEPFLIVQFNLESGKWDRSGAGLPEELIFARLASDAEGKKLYLIGGTGRNGISRSIKLWELNEDENWVEMETLPEMMCRKFGSICYHNYEHVNCFWHQGMICISCFNWPEILYYKVSRRTWHWLPKCPSLPEKCSCGFRWFSFVPDFHALV